MTRCSVRNRYCMVHMDRFAGNSGALALPFFRARWSIWRYWGKSAPLKRTPLGSWSPRTPRAGYVLGACTSHEFFKIYCWTEYRAPNKKLENWSSLDFLLGNGCVLHEIQHNDSRSSCFPVSLSLPFLLLIFLLVVSILLLYLWCSAYSLYILDVLYVCLCSGSILTLGIYWVSGYRLLYSSYYEYPQYFAWWCTVYRYTYILPTLLAVYIIVSFQDFTLPNISRLPTVRSTAGKQYVTRREFHSSMHQFVQVTLDMSPRRYWPSVALLIYSQYSLYFGLQYYSNTLSTRSTK